MSESPDHARYEAPPGGGSSASGRSTSSRGSSSSSSSSSSKSASAGSSADTESIIILRNLYRRPAKFPNIKAIEAGFMSHMSPEAHLDHFYKDVSVHLFKLFGKIDFLYVASNDNPELFGNVYICFRSQTQTRKAYSALKREFYAGLPIIAQMSSKKDLERLLCLSAFQNRCQRGIFCDSIHFFPPSEEVKNYLLSIQSSSSSAPPPAPAPVRSLSADEITANTSIIIIEPGSQPPPDEHPDLYDILLAQSRAIVTSSLSDPTSWVNLTPEGSNQPPRPLTPADISSMDRFTGNFLASDLDRDFSKTTTILLLASRDFVEKNAPQSVVDAVPLSYREALRGRLIVGTISYTSGEKFTAGGATGGSASAEDPAGSAIVMVRNLAVASWGRRMGFGRFLWNVAFLPAAQRQGYRSVTIHTTSNLGPALAFYSRIPALERNFGNKMLADGTIKKVYYDGPLAPVA